MASNSNSSSRLKPNPQLSALLAILVFAALLPLLALVLTINPYIILTSSSSSSSSSSPSDISNNNSNGEIGFTIFIAAPTRPWISTNGSRRPNGNVNGDGDGDGDEAEPYENLLQKLVGSWLDLIPCAKVVLMGRNIHPSSSSSSSVHANDTRVSVETNIDHNFRGTPHVHSMFARASSPSTGYPTHVSVLVMDPCVLVNPGFLDGVYKTLHVHQDWVLFSRRLKDGDDGTDDGNEGSEEVEYWAWNSNNGMKEVPFLTTPIPPFSHVRGTYERWIIDHLIESGTRVVVDASEALPAHLQARNTPESNNNNNMWESYINTRLSETSAKKNVRYRATAPWKLIQCAEPTIHNLCMVEHHHHQNTKDNAEKRKMMMTTKSLTEINTAHEELYVQALSPSLGLPSHESMLHPWKKVAPGIPHSLDELLPQVVDENNVVVMVGGTSNYKEMLLSYICRVQSLGVKAVLIAAFDEALFQFAYMQGLAVYLESSAEDARPLIGADGQCMFASECFKQVSKLKSSSVLRVLRRGYNVLWSDMDIFWFKNPLPQLRAFGPGTMPIQSDEPDEWKPENSIRGANSGFYLARSDEKTINAFRAIVGHAMGTDMTEQPSFYDVLCGVNGENRVGERQCSLGADGLRIMFLSHEEYPNGNVFGHWEAENVSMSCLSKGCVILHNNYIQGKDSKMKRFVVNGMWSYDVRNHMCIQPWHPMSLTRTPLSTFQDHFLHALNLTTS